MTILLFIEEIALCNWIPLAKIQIWNILEWFFSYFSSGTVEDFGYFSLTVRVPTLDSLVYKSIYEPSFSRLFGIPFRSLWISDGIRQGRAELFRSTVPNRPITTDKNVSRLIKSKIKLCFLINLYWHFSFSNKNSKISGIKASPAPAPSAFPRPEPTILLPNWIL